MKRTITFISLLFFLVSCASHAPEPVATAILPQTQVPIPTATITPQPEQTFVDELSEISAIYDENGDPTYVLQDDVWVAAELNAYGLLQARASDNRVVIWNFEKQEWEPAINWKDMDLTEIVGSRNRFHYNEEGTLEILSDARKGWVPVVSVNENGTLYIYHDGSEEYYTVERDALGIEVVNGLGSRIIATVEMPGYGPVNKIMMIPEYSTFVTPPDLKDAIEMNMDLSYLHFAVDMGIIERAGLLQVSDRLRSLPGRELYIASGSGARIHFSPIYNGYAEGKPIPTVTLGGADDPFEPLGEGNWNWNDREGAPEAGMFNVFAYNWQGKIVIFTRFGDSFDRRVGIQLHLWEDPSEFDPKGDGKAEPTYFQVAGWAGAQQITMYYSSGSHDDWFLIRGFPSSSLLKTFWDGDLYLVIIDPQDSANIKAMIELQRRIGLSIWSR